jgi:hypothetical protein
MKKMSSTPKILMLVLASDTDPIYCELQDLWRQYMNTNPHVECIFYKADPTLCEEARMLDSNTLVVQCEEHIDKVFEKTLKAFRFFESKLDTYDFLFRTNLSSFVILDRYVERCKQYPRTGLCAAKIGYGEKDLPFPSGAGFTLTPDIVKRLLTTPVEYDTQDDVTIGRALQSWSIPIHNENRFDILPNIHLHQLYEYASKNPAFFHVRTKTGWGDRRLELDIYRQLIYMFY